jgi:uncharacterized protein (TIGR02001 family)
MNKTSWVVLAAIATAAAPVSADVAGNVAISTDYRFRGISQTDRDPAISGGFDFSAASGLYVGAWASNVQFGGSIEMDYYAGWRGDVADGVGADIGYLYYNYPSDNADPDLDYSELYGKLTMGGLTGALYYSPDYFGETDTFWYLTGDYAMPLGESVTATLHLGYNVFDDESRLATFLGSLAGEDPGDDYFDWSVKLTTKAMGVDLSLAYVDTSIDEDECAGTKNCDSTIVLSIGKAL